MLPLPPRILKCLWPMLPQPEQPNTRLFDVDPSLNAQLAVMKERSSADCLVAVEAGAIIFDGAMAEQFPFAEMISSAQKLKQNERFDAYSTDKSVIIVFKDLSLKSGGDQSVTSRLVEAELRWEQALDVILRVWSISSAMTRNIVFYPTECISTTDKAAPLNMAKRIRRWLQGPEAWSDVGERFLSFDHANQVDVFVIAIPPAAPADFVRVLIPALQLAFPCASSEAAELGKAEQLNAVQASAQATPEKYAGDTSTSPKTPSASSQPNETSPSTVAPTAALTPTTPAVASTPAARTESRNLDSMMAPLPEPVKLTKETLAKQETALSSLKASLGVKQQAISQVTSVAFDPEREEKMEKNLQSVLSQFQELPGNPSLEDYLDYFSNAYHTASTGCLFQSYSYMLCESNETSLERAKGGILTHPKLQHIITLNNPDPKRIEPVYFNGFTELKRLTKLQTERINKQVESFKKTIGCIENLETLESVRKVALLDLKTLYGAVMTDVIELLRDVICSKNSLLDLTDQRIKIIFAPLAKLSLLLCEMESLESRAQKNEKTFASLKRQLSPDTLRNNQPQYHAKDQEASAVALKKILAQNDLQTKQLHEDIGSLDKLMTDILNSYLEMKKEYVL